MWNSNGGFGENFEGGYGGGENQGGGFMDTSAMDSPAPGAKKERRGENLIPLTIATIANNEEESLTVNGRDVHMVSVLGIVRQVEVTSTKISYVIDDHTAAINVIKYADGENEDAPVDALAEGVYAQVFGPVRTHQGKKHILGFTVRQIDDPNRITTHILEVIHHGMKMKQLEEGVGGGNSAVLPNSTVMQKSGGGSQNTSEKQMVFETIKSSTSEAGMSRNMIKSILEGKVKPEKIERILEEMASAGSIYTTHDEDHFNVIDE